MFQSKEYFLGWKYFELFFPKNFLVRNVFFSQEMFGSSNPKIS